MITKDNTIFVDKFEYQNINQLLNKILKNLETFYKSNGYSPKNLKMTVDMYYEIREYNPNLIKFKKGNGAYILGMKVVF